MPIERITASNRDTWIDDIASLGNAFLKSIKVNKARDSSEDQAVVDSMIAAEQSEIFLALTDSGQAVGISYFNVGTGFSCGGNYIWINGVYVLPEHRREGHGSALLAAIETFGESIDSKLIITTRDSTNTKSEHLFANRKYHQNPEVIMTKTPTE